MNPKPRTLTAEFRLQTLSTTAGNHNKQNGQSRHCEIEPGGGFLGRFRDFNPDLEDLEPFQEDRASGLGVYTEGWFLVISFDQQKAESHTTIRKTSAVLCFSVYPSSFEGGAVAVSCSHTDI